MKLQEKLKVFFIFTLLTAATLSGLQARAQAVDSSMVGSIGYELLQESSDPETKIYTVTFEVWSQDREAQELGVSARSDFADLEVLTKKRSWRGRIKKHRRYKQTISVKNTGIETRPLVIEIRRRAEKRSDSKAVTLLVAPF